MASKDVVFQNKIVSPQKRKDDPDGLQSPGNRWQRESGVCVGGVGWGVNIKTVNNVDLFFNVN